MKKRSKLCSIFLSAAIFAALLTIPVHAAPERALVWSDEFDGTTLNTAHWSYETGYGYWGNEELEYYRGGTNNIKVENGELVITAKKESYGGADYASGRITTCNKKLFQYGSIEARIKLPVGQGIWPAFWMMAESTSWPNGGEIDIMEHINNETTVYGTAHDWNSGNTISLGGQYNNIDVTQYHVYRVDWSAESISWYVDGKLFYQVDVSSDNPNFPNREIFHEPYYMILNVAVGGSWAGDPVDSSFPASMYVDYVRVYEEKEVPEQELYYVFKMDTAQAYVSTLGVCDLGQPCVYYGGRAYLPLRAAAYSTGCTKVDFHDTDETITLVNAFGAEYTLQMGSSLAQVEYPDGTQASGDMGDRLIYIDGRAYLPVRAISNLVGARIEYYEYDSQGYVTVCGNDGSIENYQDWINAAVQAFGK